MTSNRRARIRPVWVPAMPLAILLMAAALAACSGESSGSDAPLSLETESRNDDSIGAGDGDAIANDVQNDGHDAAGLFVSVSQPGSHTPAGRGVRSDGSVACRGSDVDGRATPLEGCLKSSAVFR